MFWKGKCVLGSRVIEDVNGLSVIMGGVVSGKTGETCFGQSPPDSLQWALVCAYTYTMDHQQ